MHSSSALVTILSFIVNNCASPIYDIHFTADEGALQSKDNKEKIEIVKRDIYPYGADVQLKHFPLQSLIGDLEQSLFETALSVGGLAHGEDAIMPHIASSQDKHESAKQHTESLTKVVDEKPTEPLPEPKDIILQTTERVPAKDNQPAHIIIDRISVQAHHGGVPLIPQFDIKHTKHISATIKDNSSRNTTEISIIKTASTTTNSVPSSSSSRTNTAEIQIISTEEPTDSSTAKVTTSTTTTNTTKDKLEEAEKELKEKVAEIEAVPVILSARI